MTRITVAYNTCQNALGRGKTGWWIFENLHAVSCYQDKDEAIKQARAIAVIRGQSPDIVTVRE